MYSGKKNRRILMLVAVLGCRAAASFTKTQLKRRMKHRRLRHENRSVRYRNRCFDSPIYKGVGVCYVLVKMPISRPYIPTVKHNHDCCAACIRSKSFRVMLLQGVSYWSVPFKLTLADRNMQVRFCLKVVLESWDWIFLGITTNFLKCLLCALYWTRGKSGPIEGAQ